MSEPILISEDLAAISATISQAEAILEMVADHGDMLPQAEGAIYGAAAIIRAARRDLGIIEVIARSAGLTVPSSTGAAA